MGAKTTVISQEQLEAQYAFCDKIENYWHQAGRTPKTPTAASRTKPTPRPSGAC